VFPGVALALFTLPPGSEAMNELAQGHLATAGTAGGLACIAGAALMRFSYDAPQRTHDRAMWIGAIAPTPEGSANPDRTSSGRPA